MEVDQAINLVVALNRAASSLTSELNRNLEKSCGVTFMQAVILRYLSLYDQVRPRDLTEQFGGGEGPTANILTRLQRNGLVKREKTFKNKVYLKLTAEGSIVAEKVSHHFKYQLPDFFGQAFDKNEADRILAQLLLWASR